MANMFDENGNYNKTEWKPGDRITAGKLNKIEESLEAINNNDIERHKEADERLDALEEQKEAVEERFDELEDLVADNKTEVDTAIYEVHSKMDRLEQELNEGIDEIHNVAETVDGKIASADAHDTNYPLKSYGVTSNLTPAPLKVYNDSIFKHKKVCGLNYVWLKASILVSEENKNANIDLTLPTNVGEGLFNYKYRQGLLMPIFVKGIQTKGRFIDNNKFRIYAPSDGWNTRDEAGYYTDIDIYLTYY